MSILTTAALSGLGTKLSKRGATLVTWLTTTRCKSVSMCLIKFLSVVEFQT